MTELIEQIKSLKGVKTAEQVFDDRIVVVFEQQEWLEPCDLVKGEIYAGEQNGIRNIFRFKKLRKDGTANIYSLFGLHGTNEKYGFINAKGFLLAEDIRHATPEEKRMLLKFEECL